MSNRFIEIDRSQPITLPGNLEGWLDGDDLAHFIVEVVEALDTQAIEAAYHMPLHITLSTKCCSAVTPM